MNKIYGIMLVLFLFTSCYPVKELALKDYSTETIELPFAFNKIEIVDKRDTLNPMNWEVPMIAAKKREWKGNPIISNETKSDILGIIQKSGKIDGIPVNIEFRVIEGVCKLNSDWKSVTEYTKFKAELYFDIPSKNMNSTLSGEMYYENKTIDGTEKHTVLLYNNAVKNVTHMLLKNAKEKIKFE